MTTPTHPHPQLPDRQQQPPQPVPPPTGTWVPQQGPPPPPEYYGPPTPPKPPKRDRRYLLIVLIVVASLAVIGGGIGVAFAVSGGGNDSYSTPTPQQQEQAWANMGGPAAVAGAASAVGVLYDDTCGSSQIAATRTAVQNVISLPNAAPSVEPLVQKLLTDSNLFIQDAVNFCAAPVGSSAESDAAASGETHLAAVRADAQQVDSAHQAVMGGTNPSSGSI